jgi:uncharacterized integral membrane protein (TIGR00698 family)
MKRLASALNAPTNLLPGILLSLCIAVPAWLAGRLLPVIGGAVFAILFGLVAGQFFRPARCVAGIKFTGKKILQYSIVLLGFEMQILNVLAVGGQSLMIMLFTLIAAFVSAAIMYRILRVPGKQAVLIGVGTCICGGSAIAATAPIIDAEDSDVARSISTIFFFNIVAVFLFPALGRALGLSDTGFGLWAGTAVNDTSSVVAAASAWSGFVGNNTALNLATIVKLTRTLLIIPVTLVLAVYMARARRKSGAEGAGSFDIVRIFPWFVIGFVVAALINSFVPMPAHVSGYLVRCGKFMIVMAMAAIGLSTDLKSLVSGGLKPILLGLVCWVSVAAVSLIVQRLSGLL